MIVEAVGSASGKGKKLSEVIEAAKVKAITEALAEGVTDQDEIRARVLAARDRAKRA